MSRNRQAWYSQNYSSADTAYNFGPFGITVTVAKLVEVSASIAFGQQGFAADPNGQIQDPLTWGVQWGPAGYTPLLLPTDLGAAGFLWSQLPKSNTWGNFGWAPATDTGNQLGYLGDESTWRGNLFIGNPIDFYVTYGVILSGFPNIYASISLEASYTY